MIIYILLGVLAVLVLWFISTYNFFVSAKGRIKGAVQEIGNQLKRQADLIPNLESSVKGYLKHEKGILDKLADVRREIAQAVASDNVQKMSDAGSKLASILPSIKVVMEDNPELKGSDVVTKLMDELRDTADKIMYARRLVIDLTVDYNVRRQTFPSNFVANMLKLEELPGLITPEKGEHLEVSEAETKTPSIKL